MVFKNYDKDSSNSVDVNEVCNLINDALKYMKSNKNFSQEDMNKYITAVNKSGDGKIQKKELYLIFKKATAIDYWK